MEKAYFPAGTKLCGFVIKTFLKQNRFGCTYLAVDPSGKKYRLSVLNDQPEKLMEKDIAIWSQSSLPGILADIRFLRDPVPVIISPCAAGLTLEECRWAEITLTLHETLDLLSLIDQIRNDLDFRGAEDSFISMDSILLTPEKNLVLQRDDLFFSHFSSIRKKLADAVFDLTEPVPGISLDKIKKYHLANPGKEIAFNSPEFKDRDYVSPRSRKLRSTLLKVIPAAAILFCAVWGIKWAAQNIRMTEPEIEEQQITLNHRSAGPVIHASEEKISNSAPDRTFFTVTPLPPAPSEKNPVKAAPQGQKPAAKKSKVGTKLRKIFKKQPAPAKQPLPDTPAIIQAVRAGNLATVRLLIARKADVNVRDKDGNTPMYYAVGTNWQNMMLTLHQAGAKITKKELDASRSPSTRQFLLQLLRQSQEGNKLSASRQSRNNPASQVWFKAPNPRWHIKLETALAQANAGKKKIVIVFVGPERHQASAAFEAQILRSPAFFVLSRHAEVVYIKLSNSKNMPQQQRTYNEMLLRRYISSNSKLPYTVVLNSKGKRMASMSSFRNAKKYLNKLRQELQ